MITKSSQVIKHQNFSFKSKSKHNFQEMMSITYRISLFLVAGNSFPLISKKRKRRWTRWINRAEKASRCSLVWPWPLKGFSRVFLNLHKVPKMSVMKSLSRLVTIGCGPFSISCQSLQSSRVLPVSRMQQKRLKSSAVAGSGNDFTSLPKNSTSRPYTIVVEGNIGSGKTTFLQPFTTIPQVGTWVKLYEYTQSGLKEILLSISVLEISYFCQSFSTRVS